MDIPLINQSGRVSQEKSEDRETIVRFNDGNPGYINDYSTNLDPSFDMATEPEAGLGSFLARPVEIYNQPWAPGNEFSDIIEPWWLWMSNPRVVNRVGNYNGIRGNLHVKVLINGNQFYWGRILMDYTGFGNSFGIETDLDKQARLVRGSQRPHIYIDPSTSQGGEMVLPFFYAVNHLPTYLQKDAENMGSLKLTSFGPLYHGSSTLPVRITIYAWMTNLSLVAPTTVNSQYLVNQVGQSGAEYGTGPLSRPASLASAGLGWLSKEFPRIKPYAMATQMITEGVGRFASLMGFSRPATIEGPCLFNPTTCGRLANVDADDTPARLALTCKQEVTVDPRTVGMPPVDELDFNHLMKIDSYFDSFEFSPSDSPTNQLWSCLITPDQYRDSDYLGKSYQYMTALSWMGRPFRFWNGTVKLRFMVIASGYHKGRLQFTWDANSNFPWAGVPTEENTRYSHIIDLAKDRDFTIEFGMNSLFPAFQFDDRPFLGIDASARSGPDYAGSFIHYNGKLVVNVLNELVDASGSTSPVQIVCFVSGEDLNFWGPDENALETISYIGTPVLDNQSGVDYVGLEKPAIDKIKEKSREPSIRFKRKILKNQAGETENQVDQSDANDNPGMVNAPDGDYDLIPLASPSNIENSLLAMAGEKVVSWRQCLKRYCHHTIVGYKGLAGSVNYFNLRQPALPYPRGYVDNGVDDTTDPLYAEPFRSNICNNTMISYVLPAYLGWRGSVRWKVTPYCVCGDCIRTIQARRCGSNCAYQAEWDSYPEPTSADPNDQMLALRYDFNAAQGSGWDGSVIQNTAVNPTLEFEIPYQARFRFRTYSPGYALESSEGMGTQFRFTSCGDDSNFYSQWCAVGEDFNCFFFNGVPPVVEFF